MTKDLQYNYVQKKYDDQTFLSNMVLQEHVYCLAASLNFAFNVNSFPLSNVWSNIVYLFSHQTFLRDKHCVG